MEKILEAANKVFFERGYEGASVDEIAMRARASKQTIYSRYSTKKDLFAAGMSHRSEAGFQILKEVLHSGKPLPAALRTYAETLIFRLIDKETLAS